jgi:hypothetical protein
MPDRLAAARFSSTTIFAVSPRLHGDQQRRWRPPAR